MDTVNERTIHPDRARSEQEAWSLLKANKPKAIEWVGNPVHESALGDLLLDLQANDDESAQALIITNTWADITTTLKVYQNAFWDSVARCDENIDLEDAKERITTTYILDALLGNKKTLVELDLDQKTKLEKWWQTSKLTGYELTLAKIALPYATVEACFVAGVNFDAQIQRKLTDKINKICQRNLPNWARNLKAFLNADLDESATTEDLQQIPCWTQMPEQLEFEQSDEIWKAADKLREAKLLQRDQQRQQWVTDQWKTLEQHKPKTVQDEQAQLAKRELSYDDLKKLATHTDYITLWVQLVDVADNRKFSRETWEVLKDTKPEAIDWTKNPAHEFALCDMLRTLKKTVNGDKEEYHKYWTELQKDKPKTVSDSVSFIAKRIISVKALKQICEQDKTTQEKWGFIQEAVNTSMKETWPQIDRVIQDYITIFWEMIEKHDAKIDINAAKAKITKAFILDALLGNKKILLELHPDDQKKLETWWKTSSLEGTELTLAKALLPFNSIERCVMSDKLSDRLIQQELGCVLMRICGDIKAILDKPTAEQWEVLLQDLKAGKLKPEPATKKAKEQSPHEMFQTAIAQKDLSAIEEYLKTATEIKDSDILAMIKTGDKEVFKLFEDAGLDLTRKVTYKKSERSLLELTERFQSHDNDYQRYVKLECLNALLTKELEQPQLDLAKIFAQIKETPRLTKRTIIAAIKSGNIQIIAALVDKDINLNQFVPRPLEFSDLAPEQIHLLHVAAYYQKENEDFLKCLCDKLFTQPIVASYNTSKSAGSFKLSA